MVRWISGVHEVADGAILLYGLRSALLALYKLLSELVREMGLEACETEKIVFTGYFVFEAEKRYIILLVYVDDLMLGSKSTRAAKH